MNQPPIKDPVIESTITTVDTEGSTVDYAYVTHIWLNDGEEKKNSWVGTFDTLQEADKATATAAQELYTKLLIDKKIAEDIWHKQELLTTNRNDPRKNQNYTGVKKWTRKPRKMK